MLKKVYDAEINALKAELVVVKESQSFICEKYDSLKESYNKPFEGKQRAKIAIKRTEKTKARASWKS